MSDPNTDVDRGGTPPHGGGSAGDAHGTVGTAAHEATEVAGTAADAAKDVAATARHESAAVAHEASSQLHDLYGQARGELSQQAASQQERLSAGLRGVGDELGAMARSSESSGVATDLVRQASERLGAAATWLGDRDPASVLDEVRAFARRRPVLFLAAAAVAGIVAGRLTRALASGSGSDSGGTVASRPPAPSADATPTDPIASVGTTAGGEAGVDALVAGAAATPGASATPGVAGDADADAPLYAESASRLQTPPEEVADERRDAF
jgi:hypothetical protein